MNTKRTRKPKPDAENISAPGRTKSVFECTAYAQQLATRLCVDHYHEAADPRTHWKPYGDLWGVLEQLDNMLCGMVRGTPEQLNAIAQARADRFALSVKTGEPTLENKILACVSKTPAEVPKRRSSPAKHLFRGKGKTA